MIKQFQQMTAYRKFRKCNIGFRNRERLFPVLLTVKNFFLMPIDPRFFLKRDCKHTLLFFWALH